VSHAHRYASVASSRQAMLWLAVLLFAVALAGHTIWPAADVLWVIGAGLGLSALAHAFLVDRDYWGGRP
jgi:uncharacterized membrane protein YhhN